MTSRRRQRVVDHGRQWKAPTWIDRTLDRWPNLRRPWQALIWALNTDAPTRIYWTSATGQTLIGPAFFDAVAGIDWTFNAREALVRPTWTGPAGAKPTCYMNEWHSISPFG
jgi:hypothetical protein